MPRRQAKPKSKPAFSRLLRGEVTGGLLVVFALITLLSLLSPNRGELTTALVAGLRVAFGLGVWWLPFLVAALGVWLAMRGVAEGQVLSPGRLAGGLGLFLVFEGVAHLAVTGERDPWALALEGEGGGAVGWLFSRGLILALGMPAALGTLLALAIVSLLALTGLSLPEVGEKLAAMWHWICGTTPEPEGLKVSPPLPPGHADPVWRRWWRRLRAWWPTGWQLRPPVAPPFWSNEGAGEEPARGVRAPELGTPSSAFGPGQGRPEQLASVVPRIIGGSGQSWRLPVLSDILEDSSELDIQGEDLRRRAQIIESTLLGFGVPVQVVEANQGPAVTQFGLRPGTIIRRNRKGEETRIKVRVSQIQALANDLSLALAASPIRIEAPVPGRDVVGVEVPNVQISLVALRGVMESEEFQSLKGTLKIGLGRDVSGQAVVADLTRMPHLLIAGATGSGKSVCVNSIITALLLTHTPDTLRFLMIDPKRVELTIYNGIPHLLAPVVVDVERAVPVLQWATREMERRYKLFAQMSARNIEMYNEKLAARGERVLPYIVILIDELADLMLSAAEDVERYVCRIAQMARATGIHLVIATQRPSVDVVTGLIKANFPARISFAVTSQVDSRVILDTPGAEQLLGRGDMLYMAPDGSKLLRLQGCFVSERETQRLVRYWKGARAFVEEAEFPELMPALKTQQGAEPAEEASDSFLEPRLGWLPGQEMLQQPLWKEIAEAEQAARERDELYEQAVQEVRKAGRASVSLLQRRLRIGYSRAARLIDQLEAGGVIGPDLGGSRGREVLPERPEQTESASSQTS